ncbi:MAG: YicC family protein [Bacteroidales bacterium]|nr:YicC family protein [Bacteroidales bacterium]
MVLSMTGYGKAECSFSGSKYVMEVRSLNGKNADISLKTSLIPRDKEMQVRQFLTKELNRGNIDFFVTIDNSNASKACHQINTEVMMGYYNQISQIKSIDYDAILPALLRLPDVVEITNEEIDEDHWIIFFNAISKAVAALLNFRKKEGSILKADVLAKVDRIEALIPEVEKYEAERIPAIRSRIESHINELPLNPDLNRFEQELIFYIEKLDINEEKVRLAQHCRYFRETIEKEEFPGKKLGFIAQEMGREINTLGSKANHADIQKIVVKMKDELEKIKEQSLNIL